MFDLADRAAHHTYAVGELLLGKSGRLSKMLEVTMREGHGVDVIVGVGLTGCSKMAKCPAMEHEQPLHPLVRLRRLHRLSQDGLAVSAKISRTAIAKTETGPRKLTIQEFVSIAENLRLTDAEAMSLARELAFQCPRQPTTTPVPSRGAA